MQSHALFYHHLTIGRHIVKQTDIYGHIIPKSIAVKLFGIICNSYYFFTMAQG